MASSVDVVTFVREAMVRVCGGLELDAAVGRCLKYLRQHFPVDQILLTSMEEAGEQALVWATSEGVRINPDTAATAQGWNEVFGWGARDVVARSLIESGWRLGTVHYVGAEGERLGPVQAQLLAQLDGAFTAALGNHLQHQELLQRVAVEPAPDSATLLQLEPILTRALALCQGSPGAADLAPAATPVDDTALDLDQVVAAHIRRVLRLAGGRVEGRGGAAELLGVNPSTLRKRMRKLEIPYGRKTRAAPAAVPVRRPA